MTRQSIEECVRKSLEKYFVDLDGEAAANVYSMVMQAVEKPVLEVVMRQAAGNQSQAAAILGINRNTLRKKLAEHGLL
jgi:Fis family transcriptional regulator